MSKTIVMSSGGALMRYKEELSIACQHNDISTFAFSSGFMFCINELNIYPDYFAFIDPQSSMPSLEHICKNKDKINTKIILLDPIHNKLNYNDFIQWCGTTPVGRGNFGGWQRFHTLINKIKEYNLAIEIPCFTLKHIYNNLSTYKDFITPDIDLSDKDFSKRFSIDNVIIKNQLNPNFNEDKLTSVVLPILDKLKIYDISLIGFDCQGGRYTPNLEEDQYTLSKQPELKNIKSNKNYVHLKSANRGLEEAKTSISKYLPKWINLNRFKITNLVEDKYTYLKKYIKYQSIKSLTE